MGGVMHTLQVFELEFICLAHHGRRDANIAGT